MERSSCRLPPCSRRNVQAPVPVPPAALSYCSHRGSAELIDTLSNGSLSHQLEEDSLADISGERAAALLGLPG